jgi:hypothetical protein
MGNIHRSMQGKTVDMEKIMRQNELMPAIGNIRVNARGDELGPGGKIIKKREDIMAEYYETNPKAIRETSKPIETKSSEPVLTKKSETVGVGVETISDHVAETPTPKRGKVNNES